MIPTDTPRGTKVYEACCHGMYVAEHEVETIYPGYLQASSLVICKDDHLTELGKCFLTRREAVEFCVSKLRDVIRELEQSL